MSGRLELGLLAAAVLAGGLRDPLLGAGGAAAVALLAARRAPLSLGWAAWWLPWIAWSLLSCLASVQPWAGLPALSRWIMFVVFSALAARWDARERLLWLKGLCAVAALLAAAAAATGAGRGFGSTMSGLIPPYYNYTAFVLAGAAAAAAAWALSTDAPRGAAAGALWALVCALLACLVLAGSRGGLMGFGAAALWLVWRRGGGKIVVAAGAVAALGLVLAFQPFKDFALKRERLVAEARPEIWRAAARMAVGSPWLGEGPGNFSVGFLRNPVLARGAAARWGLWTPYAHSEPLQAAAETGAAGLALWLLGFFAALAGAFGGAGERDGPQAAARAATIALMPQLLVDNMLQLPGLSLSVAAILGVAGAEKGRVRGLRAPAAVLGLATVVCAASAAPAWLARRQPAWAAVGERLAAAERAAKIFPADAQRAEDVAQILEEAGRGLEAAAQWQRAQSLAPFNAIYPWRRARLLPAPRAEEELRRAVELEPDFLSARADHVVVLSLLKRNEQARAELQELRRRAAAPRPGTASGYERTIVRRERADLARAEAAVSREAKARP